MTTQHIDSPVSPSGTPAALRRRRLPRWVEVVLALAFGAIVAGFLAELLVLAVLGEQVKFPRHVVEAPWSLRYNDPGSSYRHKSADVNIRFQINREGMRAERDYEYAKRPGVKRIVSLGDSFTIGYEVKAEETFSSILERELNARKAGYDVEVLNAGVSGFGNAEECLYLERELLKYDPDIVVVSFFVNDIEDNIRSDLFGLKNGKLVARQSRYVPAGGLGNFLNTSRVFNWLAERSNAFCFVKERLTTMAKRDMVAANVRDLAHADFGEPTGAATAPAANDYPTRLAAAIFERMYEMLSAKGIPLVVQSIPGQSETAPGGLIDGFPLQVFHVARPGITYVAGTHFLRRNNGKEHLYWTRSHGHWTPFSHRLSGETLARTIVEHGWLRSSESIRTAP